MTRDHVIWLWPAVYHFSSPLNDLARANRFEHAKKKTSLRESVSCMRASLIWDEARRKRNKISLLIAANLAMLMSHAHLMIAKKERKTFRVRSVAFCLIPTSPSHMDPKSAYLVALSLPATTNNWICHLR